MRVCRFLVLVAAVAAVTGCAQPPRQYAASPVVRSDLDMITYGAPASYRQAPMYGPATTAYGPPPQPSRTVRYATQYVPVREMPPEGPYTLDTGDKLRIVVFGQDTLSNTYTVDAAGMVTLPLIGAVTARDQTIAALGAAIKSKLAGGYIREPSVAVEVDVYRPFFVLGEVTYPGNTRMCRT